MKIMFLDESGDHSLDKIDASYPMFVLAGSIFDLDYYKDVVEPETRKLKMKHFGAVNHVSREKRRVNYVEGRISADTQR
ncbi:MAG TPA: DUF3800 domain-containing protein [Candidatus Hodarchaeales archaeon]|nr:DUF3800 domain-containing protein [Candidatus Hodarchaeales archaeon]